MKVWVYSGQHDLEIEVRLFGEEAKEKAIEYARQQKELYKKRLIYTLDLKVVTE
jgi:hypothetical protein